MITDQPIRPYSAHDLALGNNYSRQFGNEIKNLNNFNRIELKNNSKLQDIRMPFKCTDDKE